jgi:hypothetical protein
MMMKYSSYHLIVISCYCLIHTFDQAHSKEG